MQKNTKEKREKNGVMPFDIGRKMSGQIAIHDVAASYPILMGEGTGVVGVEHYLTRALQMPYAVVYVPKTLQDKLQPKIDYYRKIGIGPKEVIFLDSDISNFTQAAVEHALHNPNFSNYSFSLFHQSEETERQIKGIKGLDIAEFRKRANLSSLRSAEIANKKAILRKILENRFNGRMQKYNPLFFIEVNNDLENEEFFNQLKEKIAGKKNCNLNQVFILIKAQNSAAGDAMKKVKTWQEAKLFINETRKRSGFDLPFLFEEALEFEPENEGSAQFYITESGEIKFLGLTRQRVEDKSHMGNYITADENSEINTQLNKQEINDLKMIVEYYAKRLRYKGYFGLDFVKTNSGEIVLFEVNARMTGASYLLLDYLQLLGENAIDKKDVILGYNNIYPDPKLKIDSFEAFAKLFEDMLFFPGNYGVIPTMTTFPGKFGIAIIEATIEYADKMLEEVKKRLGHSNI